MGASLRQTIRTATFALALGGLVTVPAAATAPSENWDVSSDPGAYSPVVLGDTITLDACASKYFDANDPGTSFSLCELSDLGDFTLRWKVAADGGPYHWVTGTYSGTSATDGLHVNLATGAGSYFQNAGTYSIGLYLTVRNKTYVLLPTGGQGWSNSNFNQGNKTTGFSGSVSLVTASVPEPEAALLLLPGLMLVALSERRRRRAGVRGLARVRKD